MAMSNQRHQNSYTPANEAPATTEFPSARYFQIHFEHMEGQLQETNHSLANLQQQVAELYLRLTALTPDLTNPEVKK
jgi:hypothetical protein